MTLEASIDALTKALEANTAALKGGGAGKPAGTSTGTTSGYTPKHDRSKMNAIVEEVREKFGLPVAKELIKAVAGVDKRAEITDAAMIDKVYEAAAAKLKEDAGNDM